MGNIPSYLQTPNVFTQCIRKRQQRKTVNTQQQQFIDIDFTNDNEEIIYDIRNLK